MIKKKFIALTLCLFCLSRIFAAPCGDVNSDGTVSIIDALMIAQHYVSMNPQPFDQSVADVNADKTINIVDALIVAQYYIGLISELACPGGGTPELKNKCMFVCADEGAENWQYDDYILPVLESWGYIMDKKHEARFVANYTAADYEGYDFIFLSETAMSDDIANLKDAPLPVLNCDGWTAKEAAFAYAPGRPCGFSEKPAEPVVILEEARNHALAVGIAPGTVVALCDPSDLIVWVKPAIPVIKIAGLESDPSRLVVYGIEAGTQNINGVVLKNRMAVISVHCWGYETLTQEALSMYKAGIDWILAN